MLIVKWTIRMTLDYNIKIKPEAWLQLLMYKHFWGLISLKITENCFAFFFGFPLSLRVDEGEFVVRLPITSSDHIVQTHRAKRVFVSSKCCQGLASSRTKADVFLRCAYIAGLCEILIAYGEHLLSYRYLFIGAHPVPDNWQLQRNLSKMKNAWKNMPLTVYAAGTYRLKSNVKLHPTNGNYLTWKRRTYFKRIRPDQNFTGFCCVILRHSFFQCFLEAKLLFQGERTNIDHS